MSRKISRGIYSKLEILFQGMPGVNLECCTITLMTGLAGNFQRVIMSVKPDGLQKQLPLLSTAAQKKLLRQLK